MRIFSAISAVFSAASAIQAASRSKTLHRGAGRVLAENAGTKLFCYAPRHGREAAHRAGWSRKRGKRAGSVAAAGWVCDRGGGGAIECRVARESAEAGEASWQSRDSIG